MSIRLAAIVLYGSDGTKRRQSFNIDGLSIITGDSKTGKSAIIHIVDYCLASGECHVPEGIIRRKVEWFAVILERDGGYLFVARRNPPRGRHTSSDIFVTPLNSGTEPELSDIVPNASIDGLKDHLTRFVGIEENLYVPGDDYTRDPLEANISHARIYNFQDQSLIDNKNQLFFNQSDSFVAQAIRDTLPYFLGVTSKNELIKQQELQAAKRELKLLEREIDASVNWETLSASRAASLLAEARQVQLASESDRATQPPQTLALLTEIASRDLPSPNMIGGITSELDNLLRDGDALRRDHEELRSRIEEAKAFGSTRDAYEREVVEQAARLRAITLFPLGISPSTICPLCESEIGDENSRLAHLRADLNDVSGRLENLRERNPRLQSFVAELSTQLSELETAIRDNQIQINSVRAADESLRGRQELYARQSRVMGRISGFLETRPDDELLNLKSRQRLLQDRIRQLESDLTGDNYADRLQNAQHILSMYMTEYAKLLELEHSEGRTWLDMRRLTVVADTIHGTVRLENMGSGDNWVGCHVLSHIALHRWFREANSPVPKFIIFDQPSKAHYPPSPEQMAKTSIADEERRAVLRLFKFIHDEAARRGIQAIVVDHADESPDWFQNSIVARWRGPEKLVPEHWPDIR